MAESNYVFQTDNEKIRQSEMCHFATNIEKISRGFQNNNNNIISVMGKPESSTQYLSNLVQKTPGLDILMDLTPAQATSFVPNFQLYKSYKVSDEDPSKVYNFEYAFPTFVDPQDIRDIADGRKGTYRASGVKNISIDVTPSNMYLANRTVKVNMSIFCNSLEDLYEPIGTYDGEITGLSKGFKQKTDLVTGNAIDEDEIRKIRIMDLIYVTGGGVASDNHSYNPFYTTRLSIGWGIPSNIKSSGIFKGVDQGKLLMALRATRINLDLKYITHTFDLQESGYVTLNIEFIGALDHTMLSMDILRNEEYMHLQQKLLDDFVKVGDDKKDKKEKTKDPGFFAKTLQSIVQEIVDAKDAVMVGAIKEQMKVVMNKKYSYILDNLESSGKIHREIYEIPDSEKKKNEDKKEERRSPGSLMDDKLEGYIKAAQKKTTEEKHRPDEVVAAMEAWTYDLPLPLESDASPLAPARDAVADPEGTSADTIVTETRNDQRISHYIFLGDLLEEVMKGANAGKFFKMLLGSVSYMIQSPSGRRKKEVCVPLAAIPIPLTLFNIYFIENIIKPQRANMALTEFITGIFENVVKAIVTQDCSLLDTELGNFSLTYSQVELAKKSGQSVLSRKEYTMSEIERIFEPERELARYYASGAQETDLYLLVNASSHTDFTSNLKGDIEEDKKRGIFHFSWGLNKGIIKSLSFSKTELPKMREIRVTSNEPSDPLSRFKEPYDAEISFIGPCFLYPGQIHYINPKFIGAGDPKSRNSLAKKLLLGGYYAAIGTTINFAPGDLSCSTRLVWQGSGKLQGDDLDG